MEKITIRSLIHLVVLTLLASPAIGAPLASPRAALGTIANVASSEAAVYFPKRHADSIATSELVSRQFQDGSSELGAGEENGKRAIRARQGFQDGSSELGAGESNGKRAIGARQGFQDGSSELGATENGKQR
ncbi:hypothetical protein L207DRAFT_577013 [Hyaloscypha variabilis F]|uniref:Uncharacterized protein n=1 Tax=Hyaloscypha variabilis (strain UAMH 11265 / GT02V1 / F) TaxID=1149755 RepID=A0A2J6S5U9_HYAVF|nr:hypothetical protein L207DRAFT_577013 [Hyaloscypha variabilis F]